MGLPQTFKCINCAFREWINNTEYVYKPNNPNVSHTLASTPFIICLLIHHFIGKGECGDTVGLCVSISVVISSLRNVVLIPFPHCTVTYINDLRSFRGRAL